MDAKKAGLQMRAALARRVGPELMEKAETWAQTAVSSLDRDNHWTQEPAHVFRVGAFKAHSQYPGHDA